MKKYLFFLFVFLISLVSVNAVVDLNGTNLRGYWSFDNPTKPLIDEKLFLTNLSQINSAVYNTTECTIGNCWSLGGHDTYLLGTISGKSGWDNNICFSMWIWARDDDLSDAGLHYFHGLNPMRAYQDSDTPTGNNMQFWDGGSTVSWNNISYYTYQFFTWTTNGTTFELYGNGELLNSTTGTPTISSNELCIGITCTDKTRRGWHGNLDEVSIYNESCNLDNHIDLYNNGIGCNPLVTECQADEDLTLNTNLIEGTNSTDNPFSFNFNGTVVDTVDLFNCTFFVNASIETTLNNIPLNNTNYQLNFSNGNGAYEFNVTCINNESIGDSFIRNVFIDTIEPTITIISDFTNNSLIIKDEEILNLTVNYSDTHLFAINFTIYRLNETNSREFRMNSTFVDNISTTSYILNFTDNLVNPNWEIGKEYEVELTAWDDHTINIIPNYQWRKYNIIHNDKNYKGISFANNRFNMSTPNYNKINDFTLNKIDDRYNMIFNFSETDFVFKLYYETKKDMIYLPNSDYQGHFVIGNKHWLDHEPSNPNMIKNFSVRYLKNLDIWEISFIPKKNEVIFNSIGDLNTVTESYFFTVDKYTSYFSTFINISDTIIDGTVMQLVSNTSFNLSQTQTLILKSSFNTEKSIGGTTIFSGRIDLDGVTLLEEDLRTFSSTDIGVSGFSILNFTRGSGNYNLEIYFAEDGAGTLDLFNIDFTLLELQTINNELVCDFFYDNNTLSFSNTDFQPLFNFTSTNNYISEYFIQNKKTVSATGTETVRFYFNDNDDGENSTYISRFLSGVTDLGSLFNVFIDEGTIINRNFSLVGDTLLGETVTCNSQIFGFCLRTENQSKINHFTTTNPITNLTNDLSLTSGTHNIVNSSLIIRNGTNIFTESSLSVVSTSGSQLITMIINDSLGNCHIEKERTLSSNSDIGNLFITSLCNGYSVDNNISFNLWLDVANGETVDLLDEVLVVLETSLLDTTSINVPPVLSFVNNLDNVTAGQNAVITVEGFDVNGDNLTITANWYVENALVSTEIVNIDSGDQQLFTLSSGFYVAGQTVNATFLATDGLENSNLLVSNSVIVSQSITIDTELLSSINNTLTAILVNQDEVRGDSTMLWIIIFIISLIILGLITKVFFFWTISGALFYMGYMRLGEIFIETNSQFMRGSMYVFLLLGILMFFLGLILQYVTISNSKKNNNKKDFYDMYY